RRSAATTRRRTQRVGSSRSPAGSTGWSGSGNRLARLIGGGLPVGRPRARAPHARGGAGGKVVGWGGGGGGGGGGAPGRGGGGGGRGGGGGGGVGGAGAPGGAFPLLAGRAGR